MEQNVVDCIAIAKAGVQSLRNGSVPVDIVYW